MGKRAAVAKALEEISGALPHLIRLPSGKAWIDYDEEADVLYVSLKRPQKATDTVFLRDTSPALCVQSYEKLQHLIVLGFCD